MSGGLADFFQGAAQGRLRRSVLDPVTGQPVITSAPTGEIVQRGNVLPIGRDDSGALVPAVPGMIASAYSGATLPRDIYQGKVDLGSDEAIGRTLDLAGLMAGGSVPAPVPAGAIRTFGGRAARTADHAALDRAADLRAQAATPGRIWDETGWALGPDGMARFEIPDNAARLRQHGDASATTLGGALEHRRLFDAYPELADVPVYHRPELGNDAAAHPIQGWIAANLHGPEALPALLHEAQHFVQNREGFASGTNPTDPLVQAQARGGSVMDAYRGAAGEVEARNVERRRTMTPLERRVAPPWVTEDVSRADQWTPRSIASFYGARP